MTTKKKEPQNYNVNVNMQDRMVEILDALVEETGSSTRAEVIRILVRDEAKRRGMALTTGKKAKRKG